MTSYKYSLDGRLIDIPELTQTATIVPGGANFVSSLVDTSRFEKIVIKLSSSAMAEYTANIEYGSDGVGPVVGTSSIITLQVAAVESKIIGKSVRIVIIPPLVGSTFNVVISAYFSTDSTVASGGGGGEYLTIDVPISASNELLITKNIISAQTVDGSTKNIRSFRAGELQVGKYDGSMRQQTTPMEEVLSMPRHEGFGLINATPAIHTITYSNEECSISGTGVYAESSNCALIRGYDATLALRFACRFSSGTSRLVFGDSMMGVGVNAGVFGITYTPGASPHVYRMTAGSLNASAGNCIITLDNTVFDTATNQAAAVPWGFADANRVLGNPITVAMNKGAAYIRRVGPSAPFGTTSIADACFYSTSTVVSYNPGTGIVWIPSSSFNIDKMDGTGTLPAITSSTVIRGELIFTPIGEFILMISNPNDGGALTPVHRGVSTTALYRGSMSRLGVYMDTGTIRVYGLGLYAYQSPAGQKRTLETDTCWYTWSAAVPGTYLYIANILSLSTFARVYRIRVTTDYVGTMYLLTNTSSYAGGTEVTANGLYITTTSELVDVGGNPLIVEGFMRSKTLVSSGTYSDGTNRFYDVTVASAVPVNGVATFDDISLDRYSGFTVAINGTYRGSLRANISVDYLI